MCEHVCVVCASVGGIYGGTFEGSHYLCLMLTLLFLKIRHSQNYLYFSFTVNTEGKERVCVYVNVCVRV